MNTYDLSSAYPGVRFFENDGIAGFKSFFGFPGVTYDYSLEAQGCFFLDADTDRYEAGKWVASVCADNADELTISLNSKDGVFTVNSMLALDKETGILSRRDILINNDDSVHTVYAALPRVPLHADGFEIYAQTGGWSAENNGAWGSAMPGSVEIHNAMGRSTANANPFACIRQKMTGRGVAMHVLPVGNWVIRVRTLTGHKTNFTVLELGLSDRGLRMDMAPGERLELPETLYYHFDGRPEEASERLHLYLLKRYVNRRMPEAVYNTWFFCFDNLSPEILEDQIEAAKDVGCKYFVVDSGWYGERLDWWNQVGDWDEAQTRAFKGKLGEFADYIRSKGLKFGMWMDPEHVATQSRFYQEHGDWLMKADRPIIDFQNPEAAEYFYELVDGLIKKYKLSWLKYDCNLQLQNDLTGSNFYRYYVKWYEVMDRLIKGNPDCVFEGCTSGGQRTDIESMLDRFAGHFISDTVNPLEALCMRRNAMQRMLPQYFGMWNVLHQIDFPVSSYFERDPSDRRKTFACADAWWHRTLDLDVDFCMKAMILGLPGFSGNLASLDAESRRIARKWLDFYHENAGFFANAISCVHTAATDINDLTGWHVFQYSLADRSRTMLFAFRLKDNRPRYIAFPKHIEAGRDYSVSVDGEGCEIISGEMILSQGILVECQGENFEQHDVYSAKVLEITRTE